MLLGVRLAGDFFEKIKPLISDLALGVLAENRWQAGQPKKSILSGHVIPFAFILDQ